MKKLVSFRSVIRALSVFTLFSSFALNSLSCHGPLDLSGSFAFALYPTAGILLCEPVARQDRKIALFFASLISVCAILCSVLRVEKKFVIAFVSLCVFLVLSIGGMSRFMNPRVWFGEDAIWCTAQEYAALIFSSFFMILGIVFFTISGTEFLELAECIFLSVLCVVLYYRAYTGHTVFISNENEKKIMDMNRLSARSRLSVEDENELVRLKVIYTRSENIMNEKKPFLDSDFSLENLAVLTYCNRGQLSRAINTFAGMNFKSYLNRHRIDYALGLIEKDPRLKVSELSTMSGFCTSVSFTMAFKHNVNMLPSDYLREKVSSGFNPT